MGKKAIKFLNQFAQVWMQIGFLPMRLFALIDSKILAIVYLVISWPIRFMLNLPFIIVLFLNYGYAFFVFRILNRVIVKGRNNLPLGVGILYLSSHQTWLDPWGTAIAFYNIFVLIAVLILMPEVIYWTVAEDRNYGQRWFGPYLRFSKMMTILRVTKHSSRQDKLQAIKDWRLWSKILEVSNLLIYPEGGRSREGNQIKQCCEGGVSKLVYEYMLRSGDNNIIKYIVPIRLIDFYRIQPPEKEMQNSGAKIGLKNVGRGYTGKVIIGQPIDRDQLITAIGYNQSMSVKKAEAKISEFIIQKINSLCSVVH